MYTVTIKPLVKGCQNFSLRDACEQLLSVDSHTSVFLMLLTYSESGIFSSCLLVDRSQSVMMIF